MRVVIIEDENKAALRLKNLIAKVSAEMKTIAVLDSIDTAVLWLKENKTPDLIFLDIHLSDGLSFKIFEQVTVTCPVIFTTAYDQYALRAFELNSIDYLLKPIDKEKLRHSIDKFQQLKKRFSGDVEEFDLNKLLSGISLTTKTYKSRFLIHKNDAIHIVNTDDIAYFYAEDKVTFIMTKGGKRFITDDYLDAIIKDLNPSVFYRINRQMIVSIEAIAKINSYFNYKLKLELLPGANELNTVISRAKVRGFKEWLKGVV